MNHGEYWHGAKTSNSAVQKCSGGRFSESLLLFFLFHGAFYGGLHTHSVPPFTNYVPAYPKLEQAGGRSDKLYARAIIF